MPSAAVAARRATIGISASRVVSGGEAAAVRRARPCRRAGSRRWPRSRRGGAAPSALSASMRLDDVGRADAGARDAREPAGSLQRGAGVERRRHRVGAEGARGQGCRRRRRAAPRRSRRRSAAGRRRRRWRRARRAGAPRPRRRMRAASSAAIASVSIGTKSSVRPSAHDLGAERRRGVGDQVAAGGAVLVDADPAAGEAAGAEEVDAAREVARGHAGRRPRPARKGFAAARVQRRDDAGLVGLGDLAVGAVELQAVAVEGDVAAGDHDRGRAAPRRLERQRRGRHHAAVDGGPPSARIAPMQAAAIRGELGRRSRPTSTSRAPRARDGAGRRRHSAAQTGSVISVTRPRRPLVPNFTRGAPAPHLRPKSSSMPHDVVLLEVGAGLDLDDLDRDLARGSARRWTQPSGR